jgi:hypothetical protein
MTANQHDGSSSSRLIKKKLRSQTALPQVIVEPPSEYDRRISAHTGHCRAPLRTDDRRISGALTGHYRRLEKIILTQNCILTATPSAFDNYDRRTQHAIAERLQEKIQTAETVYNIAEAAFIKSFIELLTSLSRRLR